MYAVIETGGKQYKIQEGDILSVERLGAGEGEKVSFDKVLLVSGEDGIKVGKPYVEGAAVEGEVLFHGKGRKIIVFKYKARRITGKSRATASRYQGENNQNKRIGNWYDG